MSDWGNPWNWMGAFVLVVGWLFYDAMRPVKDYYVLQRRYFERLYEEPWRGKQLAAHYHGFDDYLAAKAVFERHEENYINVLDDGGQEAEHTLFMTTARTKSAALGSILFGPLDSVDSLAPGSPRTSLSGSATFCRRYVRDVHQYLARPVHVEYLVSA